ncbi:MAG: hypothetical protein JO037_01180, partial [Actinobacteria bacterium]|nr:hypothetical protein [Actinomycetota bacterium]
TAAAKANSASSPVAVVGTQLTDLADSEEAAYLLQALPGNGATAVEYYYTAVGLEAGENAGQALGLLQKAATLQPDPRTHANILRAEAQIFYDLHKYGPAEGDITLAEEAFSLQNPDETSEDYWNNKAFTELFDVQYRVQIDCQTALNEYSDGVKLVNTLSGDTAVFTSLEKSDRTALITRHLPAAPIPPVDAGRYCRT